MNFRRRIIRGDYAKPSAFDLMADIFVSYAKPDRALRNPDLLCEGAIEKLRGYLFGD
jgi:hypothetical protein